MSATAELLSGRLEDPSTDEVPGLVAECEACDGHGFTENCTNGGNCPCDGSTYCRPLRDDCEECSGRGVIEIEREGTDG